jgi:uncharacterized protein involved in exopolysaccharide biosynthesis
MANAIAARRTALAEPSEVVEALVSLRRQFASDLAAAKATYAEQLADLEARHSAREAQTAGESAALRNELATARNELRGAYTRIEVYRQALQGCAAAGETIALAAKALG